MLLGFGLLTVPQNAMAHGVGFRNSPERPVALEFYYSTGEPMAYQSTEVFSPDDEKHSFIDGRTDENGRFSFVPNANGLWKVIVSDDEGHRANGQVEINLEALNSETGGTPTVTGSSAPEGFELAKNALFGVSLLFNLGVAVLLWKRRGPSCTSAKVS